MEKLKAQLMRGGRVLLVAPHFDVDAVGAMVALARACRRLWAESQTEGEAVLAGCPNDLKYLAEGEMICDATAENHWDIAVCVDGDPGRIGSFTEAFASSPVQMVIDHHKTSNPPEQAINLVDSTAASTTLIVYELFKAWGLALDADLATPLYAGLLYDTGGLRFASAGPRAFRAAAEMIEAGASHSELVERLFYNCPLRKAKIRSRMLSRIDVCGAMAWSFLRDDEVVGADLSGLVDDLIFLAGIELGALLILRNDGIKLSLRSRGRIDVALLARSLSETGGGHARAAGALVPTGNMRGLVEQLEKASKKLEPVAIN